LKHLNFAIHGLPLAQANPDPVPVPPEGPATPEVGETIEVDGAAETPVERPPAPWWADGMFIPMMLILLMVWLLIFRPKSKQEKQRVQMISSLKKGDRIQTIGGILGTVLDVRDDEVVVKVDETSNAKITFSRNAIHRIREEQKK
jgi:preprotein translocase subunit YajC